MKTIITAVIVIGVLALGYYWYTNNYSNGTETPYTDNYSDSGKLDINVICEGALAYMTFPDGASAEKFVAECKAGEHPEVIEQYKAQMNLGAGVAI